MSENDITYITDACLITCVVPMGRGDDVMKVASDLGVTGGVVFQGRGTGVRERLGILGIAVEAEKEIVMMMVAEERKDVIIERLYYAAELDSTAAGFIYSSSIDKAATYIPHSIIDDLAKAR